MTLVTTTTTISNRFAGPPFAVNGGYTAGVLAERLGARGAHVQLRAPVPFDVPVEIALDDTEATIRRHGEVLVTASPVSLLDRSHPPVDFITAAMAAGSADRSRHPFPDCFVCGPNRSNSDGLHLLPGEVEPGLVAASWRPTMWQADPTGTLSVRMVTAALDCPSAFPFLQQGGSALLASMTFEVKRLPHVSEHLVVTGWGRGRDGRKLFGASAVATADGETLARANTLWIEVGADDLARIAGQMGERAA
jgi:hypothetical protein